MLNGDLRPLPSGGLHGQPSPTQNPARPWLPRCTGPEARDGEEFEVGRVGLAVPQSQRRVDVVAGQPANDFPGDAVRYRSAAHHSGADMVVGACP